MCWRSAPGIRFTPRDRSIGHSSTASCRYLQCVTQICEPGRCSHSRANVWEGTAHDRDPSIAPSRACALFATSCAPSLRADSHTRGRKSRPLSPSHLSARRVPSTNSCRSLEHCVYAPAMRCIARDMTSEPSLSCPTSPTPFAIWSTPSDSFPLRARQATKALDSTCARHIQYL